MAQLTERAREFTLASILASYPDAVFEEQVAGLAGALAGHPGAGAFLAALEKERGLDDLRSAYIELFDRGGQRASAYETEYGRMRGMSKGNDLADIAGFYKAFGLAIAEGEGHEVVDHIAVELEFYATLLLKQAYLTVQGDAEGCEIVLDARRKFLEAHLGRFARAIAERPDVASDPVYRDVFAWARSLVDAECAELGVDPAPLDFFSDDDAKREMKCGGVHLPVVE